MSRYRNSIRLSAELAGQPIRNIARHPGIRWTSTCSLKLDAVRQAGKPCEIGWRQSPTVVATARRPVTGPE